MGSDEKEWPLLHKIGLRVCRDHVGPPGISGNLLWTVFKERELLDAWHRWGASGLTCSHNGVYPWDVERFLKGQDSDD